MRTLILLLLLLSSCGSTTATTETATGFSDDEEILFSAVTSTSTILLNGTYYMYLLDRDIAVRTSTDGESFSDSTQTGIAVQDGTAKNFIRNPAVISFAEDNFVMIYEGVDADGGQRFFRATSTDGMTFSETEGDEEEGAVMVPEGDENDFMSVPDLIEFDSLLYLYYVANENQIFHATSDDEGLTWTKLGVITVSGIDDEILVDPDIVLLADGTLRLYFALNEPGSNFGEGGIYSATSADGTTFELEGQVLSTDDSERKLDPDVVLQPSETDQYFLFYGYSTGDGSDFGLTRAESL